MSNPTCNEEATPIMIPELIFMQPARDNTEIGNAELNQKIIHFSMTQVNYFTVAFTCYLGWRMRRELARRPRWEDDQSPVALLRETGTCIPCSPSK